MLAKRKEPGSLCNTILYLMFCWFSLQVMTSLYLLFTLLIRTTSVFGDIGFFLLSFVLTVVEGVWILNALNYRSSRVFMVAAVGLLVRAFSIIMPIYCIVKSLIDEEYTRAIVILTLEAGNLFLTPLLMILDLYIRAHYEATLVPIIRNNL